MINSQKAKSFPKCPMATIPKGWSTQVIDQRFPNWGPRTPMGL